jgi:hypothetical protein
MVMAVSNFDDGLQRLADDLDELKKLRGKMVEFVGMWEIFWQHSEVGII